MFVGSILNRTAHLPWLDEVNKFSSSRWGRSTSSSCCRRVMMLKGALLAGEENGWGIVLSCLDSVWRWVICWSPAGSQKRAQLIVVCTF